MIYIQPLHGIGRAGTRSDCCTNANAVSDQTRNRDHLFKRLLCSCPSPELRVGAVCQGGGESRVGGGRERWRKQWGSCFSVPADVNEIARWHLNALQKDRSLLLQLSHGVSFICIPRSGLKLSLAVGVMRVLYL